ncbi:HD family phosphohydrolase [Gloeothece verrucosa]|uniref:7TM receptor with intracellular metal dependent phosphohydrolase n=1 Tax=Gloeothece verrucosa (strain PCC 7822) TaxID=497965 RepID=E0UHB2_GLOV7|nr:HDIG domain-containing metalloprotein [Gloeothece verrucosa]ADN16826.1 7TM receptor with intracellular metal dependent phosphohydrolase [Gloeothece verrucosa PCC 7822]
MKGFNLFFSKTQKLNPKKVPTITDCRVHRSKLIQALCHLNKVQPSLIFTVAVFSLTSVVGYRFYNQPQLAVATRSPETIKAPSDGRFEDKQKTEQKRQEARTGINPILRRSPDETVQIEQSLYNLLDTIDHLRQTGGNIALVSSSAISTEVQQNLLSASKSDWEQIIKTLKNQPLKKQAPTPVRNSFGTPVNKLTSPPSKASDNSQQNIIAALQSYRQSLSASEFDAFINKVTQSRQKYSQVMATLYEKKPSQLSLQDTVTLLQLSASAWQNLKQEIISILHEILIQGLPPGLTVEHLEQTVNMQLKDDQISNPIQSIAATLLLSSLQEQSNLEIDKEATAKRAEEAAKAIEPLYVEIKKGEVIVRQGAKITEEDFVLLDGFGLSRRGIDWQGLGVSGILVAGSMGIFCWVDKKLHRPLRRRDYLLLCLLSISTPLLVTFKIPYTDKHLPTNLPAVGFLVSSFYGSPLAITSVLLLTGLTSFSAQSLSGALIAGAAGGLLAAAMAERLRSRDELALLGGAVGLVEGGVYYLLNLIVSAVPKTIWFSLLPDAMIYGLSGMAWSIVAIGISPYLERLFDLVTPIRLIELSNPNCYLLQRLATQAPGTFQHTLLVACLAEAAARRLHCNVELVRAGTLYHDIGKMHDPLGFIENQMGNPNKHDEINDPWKSAEIIKKHVNEGIVMAKKNGLPRVIRDFIPEHQGTLLIAYFYYQAKQKAQANGTEINENDFRYDGPIPQTRETGIVMLADGCEAALRSLKDATPDIARSTIHKIFLARWRDGQLKDSGIKEEELKIIADVFVQVWQQFHHQRIAYPKAALEPQSSKT